MRIEKIEIENFRGFKGKHEVSFHPNLNVFVGVNGAGKSSVLDLIGIFLNNLMDNFIFTYNRPFEIREFDINLKEKGTVSVAHLHSTNLDFFKNQEFKITAIYSKIFKPNLEFRGGNYYTHDYEEISKNLGNVPVFRYFNTKSRKISDKDFQEINDYSNMPTQYRAYEGVFQSLGKFTTFINWFVIKENDENRDKVRLENLKHRDSQLEPVREALSLFLNKFIDTKYEKLRVENDKSVGYGAYDLCIDKNRETINLGQLSSGEQQIILLVADIASKLAIANPNRKNCLQGEGIVLIDEVELHLHPEWQREVIPALTATFPNIQFFITTHSPQVLSNVKRKSIFVIDNFEFVQDIPETFGLDSNSILRDVFETETSPEHASVAFQEVFKLLEQKKIEEAKLKLIELEEKYTDNPTLKKAKTHLDFVTMKNGK
jgi:predicted ATP-binding protein involved in virulence